MLLRVYTHTHTLSLSISQKITEFEDSVKLDLKQIAQDPWIKIWEARKKLGVGNSRSKINQGGYLPGRESGEELQAGIFFRHLF